MAINWKKQRAHQINTGEIMNRFVDGKIIDTAEMHDRIVILHQVGVMVSLPRNHSHRNML
jgi:hypothetical protein